MWEGSSRDIIEEGIKERILEAKEQYFKGSMITHTERDC